MSSYTPVILPDNYNTVDQDFDKVQLLLHFNDASGTKEISDVKGHYPIGLKSSQTTSELSPVGRESVIVLDGADYGGIEISTNNNRNAPSSFNLFQDIDDITRSSDVDWCFEFFIQNSQGSTGYVASNSYSPNVENNFNSGIDWGIRIDADFNIVVVIGDTEYPFAVGYNWFNNWHYVRVYRENNTLGCWLDDSFIDSFDNVINHEKRYHNYFRIGRANTAQTLNCLLDEVRFTIGTARSYQNALIPTKAFPNIGAENRPLIVLEPSFIFSEASAQTQDFSFGINAPSITMDFSLNSNLSLNLGIKSPPLFFSFEKANEMQLSLVINASNIAPNFYIGNSQDGIYIPFKSPALNFAISLINDIGLNLKINAPSITADLKLIPSISIIATLPDLSSPILTTNPIDVNLSVGLSISMAMVSVVNNSIDVALGFNSPAVSMAITPKTDLILSDNVGLKINAPAVYFSFGSELLFNAMISAPSIFMEIESPAFDYHLWLNELLLDYSNGMYQTHDNQITLAVSPPAFIGAITPIKNANIMNIGIASPKLAPYFEIVIDNTPKISINAAIHSPAITLSMACESMSLNLTFNSPTIKLQSASLSEFL